MKLLAIIGPWQILILIFFLIGVVLPIVALVDILRSDFEGNNKIIWVLVVLFANVIGSIIYFAIGRSQRIKKSSTISD